jgi:hypothetical protein
LSSLTPDSFRFVELAPAACSGPQQIDTNYATASQQTYFNKT